MSKTLPSKNCLLICLLSLYFPAQGMVTTPAQVSSILGTSAANSAAALYNIVATEINSSQTQFNSYYVAAFMHLPNATAFAPFLQNFGNDLKSGNYAQAEIDLIKLAAAIFANQDSLFVIKFLATAPDPWLSPYPFFVYNSKLSISQTEQLINLILAEFAALHLVANGGQTTYSPSNNAQLPLLLLQNIVAQTDMQLKAISDNGQALMTAVMAEASADCNIVDPDINLDYINSLDTINSDISAQLNSQENSSIDQITYAQTIYTQITASQISTYTGQIQTSYASYTGSLTILFNKFNSNIENLQTDPPTSCADSSTGHKVDEFLQNRGEELLNQLIDALVSGAISTAILGLIMKKLYNRFTSKTISEVSKLKSDALGDNSSSDGIPADVNELIGQVGDDVLDAVREAAPEALPLLLSGKVAEAMAAVLDKAPGVGASIVDRVSTFLGGIARNQLASLMPGGPSGEGVVQLVETVTTAAQAVVDATGADPLQVGVEVGSAIMAGANPASPGFASGIAQKVTGSEGSFQTGTGAAGPALKEVPILSQFAGQQITPEAIQQALFAQLGSGEITVGELQGALGQYQKLAEEQDYEAMRDAAQAAIDDYDLDYIR